MEKIVIASDLSERSRPAVKRAVDLAVAVDAKLIVLNIVNNAMPEELSHQLQVGAQTILREQVDDDRGDRPLEVEIKVIVGDPIAEINEVCAHEDADLLVVGLHRRRRFLDQIRETTMEHLIRSSRIPILLVAKPAEAAHEKVLCGIALSGVCAAALHRITQVAPDSDLTLFHAHEVSFRKEAERDFETWKAIHPVPRDLPEPIFCEAAARDALDDIMETGSYDLLAIGGHTRASGGGYFLGRFTAGLIRNPPCDLLIAK